MGRSLSPKAVKQYQERGYYFPVRALTSERAEGYRRMAEDLHVSGRDKSVTGDTKRSLYNEKWIYCILYSCGVGVSRLRKAIFSGTS
tara:strand:+ start:413 stop:673 length:261 start_codon:yes stop_codon:yes gene_type:complete